MARLIAQTQDGPQSHELLFRSVTIGRGPLNDIVIDDPGEPRTHAEVLAVGEHRYAIRDKGSEDGVLVKGERVEGLHTLEAGDVVRVGPAEFVFEPTAAEPPAAAAPTRSLGGGVARLAAGTLVSRLFGFVRQKLVLHYFGCSGVLDAFFVALTLPNFFRRVLGEQVAESALTPAHRTLVRRGRDGAARRLAGSVLWLVAIAGAALVVLGFVAAPWIVWAVAPGFRQFPQQAALTVTLARAMMCYLVIIAVSAVFGSLLLSERRFGRYALAPVGSSVCVILAVVFFHGRLDVGAVAVGLVLGGVTQMAISASPFFGRGKAPLLRQRPRVDWEQPALRKVGRTSIPIALAGMLNRLSSVVDRALASLVRGAGRISALFSAHLLLQLPFAIFGLAVGRAAFPSLIDEASSDEGDGFARALVRALRLNAFFMLPATVGTMLLARPVVRLFFQSGRFDAGDTELVAVALLWYAVGLVGMGARSVLTRAFYARLSTRTPFVLSCVQVGTNIVLSLALVFTPLEHGGLALATSISFLLEAALLLALLRREVRQQRRALPLAGLGSGLGRMALAGAGMAAATWGALHALGHQWRADTILDRIGLLAVPGAVGMGVYLVLALVLRCEEIAGLVRRIRRRQAG